MSSNISIYSIVEQTLKKINFSNYINNRTRFNFKKFLTHLKKQLEYIFIFRNIDLKLSDLPSYILADNIPIACCLPDNTNKRIYIYFQKRKTNDKFLRHYFILHELAHLIYSFNTEFNYGIFNKEVEFKLEFEENDISNSENISEELVDCLVDHILLPTDLLKKYINENKKNNTDNLEKFLEKGAKYFQINQNFFLKRIICEQKFDKDLFDFIYSLLSK
ncbi:MAG TPA: hypothetical protein PKY81_10465 [bacterium]|nr:hypothetical protein [bacterium]